MLSFLIGKVGKQTNKTIPSKKFKGLQTAEW